MDGSQGPVYKVDQMPRCLVADLRLNNPRNFMDGIPLLPYHLGGGPLSPLRRLVMALILSSCLLLLVHAYFLEPYQIPTGSMAPTLLGQHRSCVCPSCGMVVDVGRSHAGGSGTAPKRHYCRASCPNCGCLELQPGQAPEV